MVHSIGCKLNKAKTVIIPVGSENYRKEVRESCALNNSPTFSFPEQTHILKDGETTRYLGTQVGNTQNSIEPWPKIMEEIENSLQTWEKAYPSIEGHKHIIQMIIGGKTQFLTTAQGMPAKYKNTLSK